MVTTNGTTLSVESLTPSEMAAWRGFLEAHRRVIDVLEAELKHEADLPLAWYDVLVHLSEADGHSLRMQELADAILLSKSGLTRLIDRMQQAGLVMREACLDDGRGVNAVMTPAGFERLRQTASLHRRGVREHFVDLLEPDEVELVAGVFERLARNARS